MERLAPYTRWLSSWISDHKVAVLGFAVSSAYWPGMLSGAFVPRWAAIAVGVPLVFRLDPREIPESLRWLLLWVLALAAISTTWASPDPMGGYLDLLFMCFLCLAFIAGSELDSLDEIMGGLGGGLAISSFIALWQISGASDQSRDGLTGAPPIGLFYSTEIFAEFGALVFVWAVLRTHLGVAAAAALPVLLCNSRVAWLTVALGVIYAFGPKSRWKMAAVLVALAVVAVCLLFLLGAGKMVSADHRLVLWTATVFSWTQFGHGLGWFRVGHPIEQFAHSDALQVIAELGIGAFALIMIPYIAFRNNRGTHAERATFVAVCFQTIVSFPLHFPASGFLAAIVAGYLVSTRGLVRVVGAVRRDDHGFGLQRADATDLAIAGGCGPGCRPLPVRSVPALRTAVRSREDFVDVGQPRSQAVRGF